MKLLKFIEQLRDAYKNAYAKMKAEQERHKAEESKFNAEKSKYNPQTIREESDRIKEEHKQNINAIVREVKETVAKMRVDYEKAAQAEYQPKGEELNANDVALLNSGISFSAEEVERFAQKYADNSTMLRVLDTYVRNNKVATTPETKGMLLRASRMLEVAMRAFDVFECKAKRTLELMTYNDPSNDIFTKCNERIAHYVEEYKNEMQTGITESEVESNV